MKKVLIDIFLIFLLSLTPLLWFRPGEIMVGHDNIFPLDPQSFLEGRLYTWSQNKALGQNQSLIMGSIPIHFIDALPSLLGFSLQTTQKIVYVFWFFLIGLSVYILASLINEKSRFFKLFVTVFYQFNFFILQGWWIGERTKFSAYIALPLVLSVFLLVYQRKISILKAAILNSLILFFFNAGGLFGIPLYGGLFVSVGLFIVFFFLMSFLQKEYSLAKNLILVAVLTMVGFLLVNSYYLVPALSQFFGQYGSRLGGIGGISGVLAWAQEISVGASFTNLFRLQGIAEWYDNPQHPYAKYFLTNPILISISFIWPLLIFLSLILVRKKREAKYILYFFLVYLVGIFFTAGTHPPLGLIYQLFVQFIPGFAIFRTPFYKFAPALFISSAFLCAFTLDYLREKIGKHKVLTLIFSCFWIFLILGYHFPYFTGNFFNWRENFSTRLKIPQSVFDFGNWLEKDKKDDSRVLFLPPNNPDWQYDIYKWGYLSLEPLGWLLNKQPLVYVNSQNLNKEEQPLLELTYKSLINGEKELFERLAFLLRIKYLVVRKDFYYDLEWARTESPFLYEEAIKKFNYPKKEEFGSWELYEIDSTQLENIFAFSQPDIVDISLKEIENYLSLKPQKESQFILAGDNANYLFPQCLNCRHEKKPPINFPTREILPDSIIYPLVLLKERLQLKETDQKSMIYDNIGLSLKRTAEIREMILQRKELKSEYIQGYLDLLQRTSQQYDQIQEFEDKFQIAEDLDYFLEAQNDYFLEPLLERRVIYAEDEREIKKVFLAIQDFRGKINPFLLKKDKSNNRLYSFSLDATGPYELLLRRESIEAILDKKLEVTVVIDESLEKKFEIELEDLENSSYLRLGRIELEKGKHYLLLSLPPLPNLTKEVVFSEENLWGKQMKCFSSKIMEFDNLKVYKSDLFYENDFSDDFLMVIQQKNENGERLENLFEFISGYGEKHFEELIYSKKNIEEVSVGLCSPELSKELLDTKTRLRVIEVMHPSIVLTTEKAQKAQVMPIAYEKINPTKYRLKVQDAEVPFFLAFMERYNHGWQLTGFEESHFRLNGYANGWQVNQKGDYDLIFEYQPQRLFYWGVFISILMIVVSLLYLIR